VVVLHLSDCPIGLRGALTKWLLEIAAGVFVGQVSARVRDELWDRVKEHCRNGRAVLICTASCEQRLDFRVHGDTWEPIDYDGIKLMLRPSVSRLRAKRAENHGGRSYGFSNASKQRTAKRFSDMRKRSPEDYVIVDLETTGLNPDVDEIIEIGAIKVIGHKKMETFNALIVCDKPIPTDVSELTGIDVQMLEEAGEPLNEVLVRFSEFLGELTIVGHNIDFDKRFLLNSCVKCGRPLIMNRFIDTLGMARRLLKGVDSFKLESLAAQLGIECHRSHRSMSDCETTGQLYRKLLIIMGASSESEVI